MATSSIFRTPQFRTEESVRSLVEAMEATMSDPHDYSLKARGIEVRQVRDPEEIGRILDMSK